jgi:hypothetical protein
MSPLASSDRHEREEGSCGDMKPAPAGLNFVGVSLLAAVKLEKEELAPPKLKQKKKRGPKKPKLPSKEKASIDVSDTSGFIADLLRQETQLLAKINPNRKLQTRKASKSNKTKVVMNALFEPVEYFRVFWPDFGKQDWFQNNFSAANHDTHFNIWDSQEEDALDVEMSCDDHSESSSPQRAPFHHNDYNDEIEALRSCLHQFNEDEFMDSADEAGNDNDDDDENNASNGETVPLSPLQAYIDVPLGDQHVLPPSSMPSIQHEREILIL